MERSREAPDLAQACCSRSPSTLPAAAVFRKKKKNPTNMIARVLKTVCVLEEEKESFSQCPQDKLFPQLAPSSLKGLPRPGQKGELASHTPGTALRSQEGRAEQWVRKAGSFHPPRPLRSIRHKSRTCGHR